MASLGSDLAAIREERGLSFEDVQQITKLSPRIIQSIEDDSLFKKINKDTTYVRNYARNYAKAIGIEEAEIVGALNRLEAGKYNGEIHREDSEGRQESEGTEANDPENDAQEMVEDHSPEYSTEKPAAKSTMAREVDSSTQNSSINWLEFSHKTNPQTKSALFSGWIIALLIAIFAVAGVLLYNYFNSDRSPDRVETSPPAITEPIIPADTLQEALLPASDTSPVVFASRPLPDTLTVAVIAANGKLEPVHIYTDLGIDRPYWIELRDTMRFSFVDTFHVWAVDQFARMELMFNGRVIENYYEQFYNSVTERIELSRSAIEKITGKNTPANQAAN